ncbi:MAG: glycosyltransferase family 2 protein [Candidatus Paceibacterota bacterium]
MDNNLNPKVTVLMPVYNSEKYLREAIDSILNQTFKDFEFLIINDGSTDKSSEIIKSYKDSRIRLIENLENLGMADNFNKGIELAQGEYVVRMDSDDISLPNRIETQVDFMDKNSEIGVCGSWIKTIKNSKIGHAIKYLNDSEEIKSNLLFHTSLAHPSTIIRKEAITKNNLRYEKKYDPADDYALWTQVSKITKISNIQKVLLFYRVHQKNITNTKEEQRKNNVTLIQENLLKDFGIKYNNEELHTHRAISNFSITGMSEVKTAENWLTKIKKHNETVKYYDNKALEKVLSKEWLKVCIVNSKIGIPIVKTFLKSELSRKIPFDLINFLRITKFLIKSSLNSI